MHLLHKLANAAPISLYFLARYREEVEADPDNQVGPLIRRLYQEIYGQLLDDETLTDICVRLADNGKRVQEREENDAPAKSARPQPPKAQTGPGKFYSDYYNRFVSKFDTTQSLLWLTEFNAAEARRLFLYEDFELVEHMIEVKQGLEQERNRLIYEGPMFGFGGKYSGGAGGGRAGAKDEGEVVVHDMTSMTAEQAAARISALQRRR